MFLCLRWRRPVLRHLRGALVFFTGSHSPHPSLATRVHFFHMVSTKHISSSFPGIVHLFQTVRRRQTSSTTPATTCNPSGPARPETSPSSAASPNVPNLISTAPSLAPSPFLAASPKVPNDGTIVGLGATPDTDTNGSKRDVTSPVSTTETSNYR